MVEVKENIEKIKCYLEEAEKRFGHKITLVGATKTRTSDEINYAVRSGLKTIGENKPQELRDKFDFISKDAKIHLIGHLQKNKIKYVVGKASLIQSCDSLSLACAINEYARRLGIVQNVLLEYKVSDEETKHGMTEDEIINLAGEFKSLENVCFTGLMVVLPKCGDEKTLREYCKKSQEVFQKAKEIYGEKFTVFSIGMSDDYKIALEYGSNMVRLGRAIFGERVLPQQENV